MTGILVANRGEIAVRIVRAADALGLPSTAVFARDDAASAHVRRAGSARGLPGEGVAAYLDGAAIVEAALAEGCDAVHPGYGFLSENAGFARRCAEAGLVFVGPRPEVLELFGDKARARDVAREAGVPVLPGTTGPTTPEQARAFAEEHGPVMVKALSGGGGRGMRAVRDPGELDEAYERCRSEALQAFGDGDLYVERLVERARHIEVQVVGDGTGVVHLWERDCTVQRRHQKLVEIAPAHDLPDDLRRRILDAATALAGRVRYEGLGTVEFLVDGEEFWFIEANPRLQVEHTVTEEVTGVDLVQTQIRLAYGATLADVGLARTPEVRGVAVQARVNAETVDPDGAPRARAGTLTAFTPPSGPGVRVDTYGYTGYRTSLRYDSLLAKVIAWGPDRDAALARAERALAEFQVEGVPTNLGLLRAVLRHPGLPGADTAFLPDHLDELLAAGHRPLFAAPEAVREETAARAPAPGGAVPVPAPMQGVVVGVEVAEGDRVHRGAPLMALESMKMEHVVRAGSGGVVRLLNAAKGDLVDEGAALLFLEPADVPGRAAADQAPDGDWSAEVAEIERRRALAHRMGGPAKVERQHATGRLTVRERVAA
ncbi:biotin carboxylase N-terminal domain-containing protein, partial [Actinomadura kijaniata]|uniref:acetyl/propionyl/methylcrotonyl-CoA carboxylase subunit alpha n=1 Tax=Actinomadura kijaniata TaxID=46161 RepID=UPI003F1B99DF